MTLTSERKHTEYPHGICREKECGAVVQVFFVYPVVFTHRVKHDGNKPICKGSGKYAKETK